MAIQEQTTDLYEAGAGVFELLQPVVVSRVHHPQQGAGLEGQTARVDVLDQLPEHVRLELLDDHGLVLLYALQGQIIRI